METAPLCIGVDVAKAQLDVAIGVDGDTWSVSKLTVDRPHPRREYCVNSQLHILLRGYFSQGCASAATARYLAGSAVSIRMAEPYMTGSGNGCNATLVGLCRLDPYCCARMECAKILQYFRHQRKKIVHTLARRPQYQHCQIVCGEVLLLG